MELEFPNLLIAFAAGFLSFVSPCVLPLVPAYIGYMGGRATRNVSLETGKRGEAVTHTGAMRFTMILHGLAFVLGFTVVFVSLSIVTALFVSMVGGTVSVLTDLIGRLGGLIIIFFGLHFMGMTRKFFQYLRQNHAILDNLLTSIVLAAVIGAIILWAFVTLAISIPILTAFLLALFLGGAFTRPGEFWMKVINTLEAALYADTRREMEPNKSEGLLGSFTMGVVFSAGWTPCIGPLLGSILTVTARTGDVWMASTSLTAYSLGLGIPFLITAGMMEGAQSLLRRFQKHMGKVEVASGLLMIVIGISVATGSLQNLSQTLSGQTELATRIEECGLGFFTGELSFGQTSSCLGGSLVPMAVGEIAFAEVDENFTSQEYLIQVEEPLSVDVEIAGLAQVFAGEVVVRDAAGTELARSSTFTQIGDGKYVLIHDLNLPEPDQYFATLSITEPSETPFTFRFRVRNTEPLPDDVSSTDSALSGVNEIEVLAAASAPAIGLDIGNRAPDFSDESISGESFTLSEMTGRVVLINFWGTWCGPCEREMPELQSAYETYSDQGFTILALATRGDTAEDVAAFRDDYDLTFPLLVDEGDEINDRYGVISRPSTFIIDQNGVIVFKHFGPIVESQIADVLDDLLAG